MATVVEMPLADGSTVLVEVADDEQRLERVGRAPTVIKETAETLEDALSRVKPAVAAVLAQMRALATPPETIRLEFGVKFAAEAGVVIAKAATEANFRLSLEWTAGPGMQGRQPPGDMP